MEKKLPLGIQTFRDLIAEDYLYIDKTKEIFELLTGGGKYFFLARPRRFGKSLLVSTLKEILLGNRELFEGLWIYDQLEWRQHPVIHLDLTALVYDNQTFLGQSLERALQKIGDSHQISLTSMNYKTQLIELIEKLSVKGKVAILVDEYDKPIIDKIDEPEVVAKNRELLRDFYAALKAADQYIKFVFLTGVSKFSRVSVFSGLNNLNDITHDSAFSTLLGYTQEEMEHYFDGMIQRMTQTLDIGREDLLTEIKNWYNGYSWDGRQFVYNPFSILSFFKKETFDNFWFSTGTPTFLIKLIRSKKVAISDFENKTTDHSVFESFDIDRLSVVPLLLQTGYLTVKAVEKISIRNRYTLTYPNVEVKEAFLKYLLADFSDTPVYETGGRILDLVQSLLNDDIDGFFARLKSIFASIPYNMFVADREGYYQSVVYLALSLVGMNISSEIQTNDGRIDAVIETSHRTIILEFKLGSPEDALKQIKNKDYHLPYIQNFKRITVIGVGFDKTTRNISGYLSEDLTSVGASE